jgi:major membrane immunogen (membrane-anchored lipoprotein)
MKMKYVLLITLIASATLLAGCTSASEQQATPTPTPAVGVSAVPTATAAQPTTHVISGTVTLNGQPVEKYIVALNTYAAGVDGSHHMYAALTKPDGTYRLEYADASDSYTLEVTSGSGANPYKSGERKYDGANATIDVPITA